MTSWTEERDRLLAAHVAQIERAPLTPDELVNIAVEVLRDVEAAEPEDPEPFDFDEFFEACRDRQTDRYAEVGVGGEAMFRPATVRDL